MPASSSLRIVLRPCARNSRAAAGLPGGAATSRRPVARRDDLYASAMSLPGLSWTIAEAARRFADRTAYVTPRGWSLSYADVDRISDEVAVGLAAPGRDSRRRRRAGPAGRPRVPAHLRRSGEARRHHRGRERPALGARARRDHRPGRPAPRRHHRRRPRRRFERRRARRPTGARRGASRCSPTIPTAPVAIIFTSGTTGLPKGALVLHPPTRVHHPDRRGRHLGRRRSVVQRHVVRAPRLHDQARRQPPPRRHDVHHGALARPARARTARARTHDDRRRRADAARAHAARSAVRRLRPVVGAVHRRGRRTDHARPRRGGS